MKRTTRDDQHLLNQLRSLTTRRLRLWPAAKSTAVPVWLLALLLFITGGAGLRLFSVYAVSLTTLGTPYTQNFDTLATSGTANPWTDDTTIVGWYSQFTAVPTNPTTYRADAGGSNTGAIYSWGTGTATERAFGSVASGTPGDIYNALKLTNNTGATITSLSIIYTGEQWRQGGCTPTPCTPLAQKLDFQYQVANAGVITDANTPTTGWTDHDPLDFTSPQPGTSTAAAIDGNAAANRTALSATLTVTLANGQEVWLRWKDINDVGNDHGLAIDDFSVTPQGATPQPNLTINDVSMNEGTGGTTTFTFTVSLSAPAGPGGVTFDIATADGTAQDDNPATEDNDYVAKSLIAQTIPAGSSTYTFDVMVNGDVIPETNETFFVNVTSVTGATVVDGQGQGTIQNDDVSCASLSISDVTQVETDAGTTTFAFTVSLSQAGCGTVTFDIATADGTAQDDNPPAEDNDYVAQSLTGQTITFPATYTFNVTVNGDVTQEPDQTFFVNITNVSPGNVQVADGQGLGTILNDDFTRIHTIQGNGDASPLAGQTVTTTGIVTLLRTGSNAGGGTANGFFLQTPDANVDADPNTSEGIFVFTSSVPTYSSPATPVAVGDELTVTGTVVEFNGLTEIGTVTNISLIDTGNPLPTAVTVDGTLLVPTAPPTQPQLEKYEGMRLSAASLLSVVPNDNFFDVETVLSSVPRQQVFREQGIPLSDPVPPDPTSGMVEATIPRWDENPERLKLDTNGRAGAPNIPYTSNVTFSSVTGPLDFAFDEYRLIPDAAPTASADMSAVPVPAPLADEFMVAGFNIENFNNNPTQRQKAALAIRDVMRLPDIIGVAEIFDLADLQALATEINTIAPGANYTAHLIEADGMSEDSDQDVGYLVDASRVTVNSVVQRNATETYINPNTGMPELLNDRPPLVLDANVEPSGANLRVLVVVNHLRSFIDIEMVAGDGPRVRAKRKAQAESLARLLQELQTNNPAVPVISVGDYNAFQFLDGYTDPIATIKGNPTADDQIVVDQSLDEVNPNFSNLIDLLPASEKYSFVFEGTPQVLDHVLVSQLASSLYRRIAIARNNADFPDSPAAAFEGDNTRPERNSDHDMPVAYFLLPDCTATLSRPDESFAANGGMGSFTVMLAATCTWMAVSNNPDWITVTAPVGMVTGPGTVSYTVASHTNTSPRSGTISVAGKTFTVLQGAMFLDVPLGHLFYTEIGKLSARGVTSGCGGGNFCPDASVTRQQMAPFLLRAKEGVGYMPPPATGTVFADVPANLLFAAFIEELAARGITGGCGGGNYCPASPVTRDQMAVFVLRTKEGSGYVPPPATGTVFADVPANLMFAAFIEELFARGITSGCAVGPLRYCPASPVTRGQTAVFLVRAFNL